MKYSQKNNKEKHEFALYIPLLTSLMQNCFPGDCITVTDEAIVHRIKHVLRLAVEEQCTFFDKKVHALVVIQEYVGKKHVSCKILSKEANAHLSPSITFLLPVLKREDFESALYSLTEIGVTTIQLITTDKTHGGSSFSQKDMDRAHRIVIAAAEQSKNFSYPELVAPVMLSSVPTNALPDARIFFDHNGSCLFSYIQNLRRSLPEDIVLLIGPEGDLSSEEKKIVQSKKFVTCSLTPTVLRSVQAAALGAGLIRSLVTR